MGYVYDASTRSYRLNTTTATKAVSTVTRTAAPVFSKQGAQIAPTGSFYQSTTRVSISSQAQAKMSAGVKTTLSDALSASTPASLPPISIDLPKGFASLTGLSSQDRAKLTSLLDDGSKPTKPIKSFRLPTGQNTLDLATVKAIGSDLLAKVDGNITLEINSSDLKQDDLSRFTDTLNTFKALRKTIGDRIANFSVKDSPNEISVSSSVITALGPNVWAKYAGKLNISDSISNISNTKSNDPADVSNKINTWNDLRVLNNYRNFSILAEDGIPADTNADNNKVAKPITNSSELSKFDFKLDYLSFIAGYGLLKSIERTGGDVIFSEQPSTSQQQVQSFAIAGKILDRDIYRITINSPSGTSTLDVGPLNIPSSKRTADRLQILADTATQQLQKIDGFQEASVIVNNNVLQFKPAINGAFPANTTFTPSLASRGKIEQTGYIDVTDVPVYGLNALANSPEVRSIAVKTSASGLRSNWDSLSSFNAQIPLARINVASATELQFTAQEAKKYLPLIEKIEGQNFVISDAPNAISTYANFSDRAASNLATSVDLTGTVSDLMNGASGIAALRAAGKLRSLTLTDANQSTIALPSNVVLSLGPLLKKIQPPPNVQITDSPSLAIAGDIAELTLTGATPPAVNFNISGTFVVQSNGTDINDDNLGRIHTIQNSIAAINVTKPLTSSQAFAVLGAGFPLTPPLVVQDTAASFAGATANNSTNLQAFNTNVKSIYISGPIQTADAMRINGLSLSKKMLSGFDIDLTANNLNLLPPRTDLDTLKTEGRLRSLLINKDNPNKATLISQLQGWGLSSFVKLI